MYCRPNDLSPHDAEFIQRDSHDSRPEAAPDEQKCLRRNPAVVSLMDEITVLTDGRLLSRFSFSKVKQPSVVKQEERRRDIMLFPATTA
ncbi:hypothetical protein PC129_g14051 [Phytophthora cactorum]|uniref:Uncharacterized protein n=1 Tax=Phytophthora cactorum TaxID=29920 RepID=A0A8T1LN47_9STRA|nr:hypothetical protein Pcac1_g10189 [Phytophthora cactorum]KAG2928628.1 hypothetical protein PC114_g3088 [Phytophthora cactorum]KAG2954364.1 hypothetical protein PC117_g1241 [Phytophthora cactorum]KAG3035228.1 hypothetical protein PC120_g977 [Phytophthora cactorum]KAG3041420.1 hypothetical protein PC119_g752 [Phytophthora cactorum]